MHKGGIKAVAIATPKIAELKFSFLVLAIINASPPKNAIKTSLISGLVLASSSDDSSLSGKTEKKINAVTTLITTITKKFVTELLKVCKSFVEIEYPSPSIGPIRGEISIAPITTGVELAFKPTDAINIEQTKIHAVVPRIEMSDLIELTTMFLSTSFWNEKTLFNKILIDLNNPDAFFFKSSFEPSLKSNLVSIILFL